MKSDELSRLQTFPDVKSKPGSTKDRSLREKRAAKASSQTEICSMGQMRAEPERMYQLYSNQRSLQFCNVVRKKTKDECVKL